MDFGSVLYTAHKNDKIANKEVKCYKTKFDPPKKEVKPTKPNLSANIQKYLQKREEEERRKAEEEKRKKEELLVLRSQDKKAFKRVQTMLKRTKSANKSVMEDAIDDVNTSVTMAGPQQCDEDDYGYVSKEASELYAKMMDKYANMPPEEPKFSQSKKAVPKDLNAAKDRVRAALQRVEEEEMMPHKRKRKSKSDKNDEENGEEDSEDRRKMSREPSPVEEPKPKKPKKMAPPPIDFSSLLKIAEQKQFEPIKIEKKVEDDGRPMTKRQKLEYERELESRRRKEEREAMRLAALNKSSKSSDSGDKREKPNGLGRIPKKSNASDIRPKQEISRRNSVESDDYRMNSSNHLDNDRQKSKHSSDTERPRNHYEGNNDHRKETNILKSSLLKADDRRPLKPTQPSISSNKLKSRNHNISDDEQSGSSHEKSYRYSTDNIREHKSERSNSPKEYSRKLTSDSETKRGYSERNSYNKYSNVDNEYTDSQSSNDGRKYQSSKSQSRSEANHHKYKPQVKYKPDLDKHKPDKYKPSYPEKVPSKKSNNSSSGRERSYSPENSRYSSDRYSHNRKQSCSESEHEDENRYRPSKKGDCSYKSSYHNIAVENDEERSRSPDYSNHNKKRKDSYSEPESEHGSRHEPPRKKPLPNKVKKISSLFEGSDDEQSSYYDNGRSHKENENRKPKSSYESNRQKDSDVMYDQQSSYHGNGRSHKENENRKPKSSYESNRQKDSDVMYDQQSSYHGNGRSHKENENRKPKSSYESNRQKDSDVRRSKSFIESDRQKPSSSDSKFKIPKSSTSESAKSKLSESDKYKSSENSKPTSSSSSKSSIIPKKIYLKEDIPKNHLENSKSEQASLNPKIDGNRTRINTDKGNTKPRPSTESSKPDAKENIKKPSSQNAENIKKPSSQNAEEVLKKSASVWSKPCNLSSTNSTPRQPGGLSESQLQRLREMNKKPTPSKPSEDRFRSGPSENRTPLTGRPSPRDERKSDGRPAPAKPGPSLQGKSNLLMKAAAERGAVIKAQMASSRSSESSSRPSEHKSMSRPSTSSTVNKSRDPPTKDSRPKLGDVKPKQFPPSDLRPKQFPPSDLRPRQFPPKDVRPRQFPPPDVKRKPKPRRIEDDSEDEYDSDMDSFIDDGSDLRPEDISREIQQIFGYDKSRYAGMDDDDECMESNFGQIDKEELRSLRIGAKEDYEELMRDLARKKRAKQRKEMEKGRR